MNSYKIDEQQVQKSNFETMPRLFKYLLKYKKRIAAVFALMAFGTAVDLVNPLLNERAIDKQFGWNPRLRALAMASVAQSEGCAILTLSAWLFRSTSKHLPLYLLNGE